MDSYTKHQIRSFKPIVLFHHESSFHQQSYSHSLLQYPFQQKKYQMNEYDVQFHKQKVNDMLRTNSKLWCELIENTKQWDHSHPDTLPPIQLPPIQVPLSSSTSHYYDDQPMVSPTSSSTFSSSPTSPSLTTPTSFTFSNNPLLTTSTSTSTTSSSSSESSTATLYHESSNELSSSSSPSNSPTIAKIHIDTLFLDQLDKPRRGNLPKPVTAILKKWLIEHCRNPYPTEEEKQTLKKETQLTLNQISNWFINARRRTLPIILAKLNQQYPGIKARRRRRKRSDKTMNNNNNSSI